MCTNTARVYLFLEHTLCTLAHTFFYEPPASTLQQQQHSMHCMHSMSGGLFSIVEGPCKRYAIVPTHMSGHNCHPGQQMVCSPEGNHMDKTRGFTDGWQCRWNPHNQNSLHTFPHSSTTTPVSADSASTLYGQSNLCSQSALLTSSLSTRTSWAHWQ